MTDMTDPRWSPWRAEMRTTLALAWPLILSNLSGALIHATDVFLLGRLGPQALAAGALATNLVMALSLFGMGLMVATAPMIASEMGRKAHSVRDVRRTVRQGLWIALCFCVPVWVLLAHAEGILLDLGQDPALARGAADMVGTLKWSMLPFLGMVTLRSFLSAKGRTIWTLYVTLLGVAANALLNYGLIFGRLGLPALGLAGAGLGSSIVNMVMFATLAAILVLHRDFRRYHLFGRFWRADWPRFRALVKLGLPIGLTMGFEASVFSAAVFLTGLISTASVAAHAVALQIASLTFMVPLGLAQATTVRVGLGHGRRDADLISRAGWAGFALGVGFMSLTALIMWMLPGPLVRLFVNPAAAGSAEVIRLAVQFLLVAAVFQIVDGAQVMGAAMLRGLHDTRVPMYYALFGYWGIGIGVGAFLAFKAGLGGEGIWMGLASGLAAVSLMMVRRWQNRVRLGLIPAPVA